MTVPRPALWPAGRRGWIRPAGLAAGLGVLVPVGLAALRVEQREWVEARPVPPPLVLRRTSLLKDGWRVILDPGRPGRAYAFVRSRTRGGVTVARWDVEVRLAAAPRSEILLVGRGREENPVHAPRLTRAVASRRVLATAYDPGPADNGWAHAGTTKLGWRTRRGIVAVDPAVIPLRSLLWVEGYGLAWAGDVGGAIKGDRMDLCFNRTEDAVRWGRRHTRAWLLERAGDAAE